MYRVVSPLAVEAALRRQELLPSDMDDPEALRRMAEELNMDYVLYSSLSITAGAGNWAVQLTSPHTGETVWSSIVPVPPQRPMEAVRAVTEQLDTFGRDVRLVQIGDIRRLVEAGEVRRGESLYRRYIETRPVTPELEELYDRIRELRGEEHYRTAREFAALWLFDDALVEINRALALQPEREELRAYVEEVRRLQEAARLAQMEEYVAVVTALIDQGHYESARLVLDSRDWSAGDDAGTGDSGSPRTGGSTATEPPVIAALRGQIREAIGARSDYQAALAAYWRGDYSRARAKVRTAIRQVPDRPEYGRLLDEIDRAAANRSTSDLVWEGYRTRLAAWSLKGALLGPVDITPVWEVSAGSGSSKFRNTETAKETTIDQLVVAGWYRRPYLLRPGQNTPVVSFYAGWHGGGSVRGGSEEKIVDSGVGDGTRRVVGQGMWSVAATGGGFLQARFLGFSLEGGMEVDNHLLFATRLDRDPGADRDSRRVDAAWMPGLNWFAAVGWHWNRDNRLVVRYTETLVSRVVPKVRDDTERYGLSSLVVGYGRSLR
jgi:tetratricopeptide (TPR) repeat protein